MFVRKDPFKGRKKKQMREDTVLEMEDYCSVLLYARYVREAKGDMSKLNPKLIPIVRRGGMANMPEEVCDEFDTILQKVLETIQVIDVDPEEFFNKLTLGDVDPIGDVIISALRPVSFKCFLPNSSFTTANIIKFADAPELTNNECFTPTHFDHACSNSFTF